MWKTVAIVALSLLSTGLSGCGSGPAPRISGTITLDGQPLADAMVMLVPADGVGNPASAHSDATGAFQLVPQGEETLLPGTYKVMVTKLALPKPGEPPPKPGSSPIPEIYRDPKTTPLAVEIPNSALKLELKSQR